MVEKEDSDSRENMKCGLFFFWVGCTSDLHRASSVGFLLSVFARGCLLQDLLSLSDDFLSTTTYCGGDTSGGVRTAACVRVHVL